MITRLDAVYENGVLRPLEPLELEEHQRVTVIVTAIAGPSSDSEWLDLDCVELLSAEADDRIDIEDGRTALAKIPGSLTPDFIAERDDR